MQKSFTNIFNNYEENGVDIQDSSNDDVANSNKTKKNRTLDDTLNETLKRQTLIIRPFQIGYY